MIELQHGDMVLATTDSLVEVVSGDVQYLRPPPIDYVSVNQLGFLYTRSQRVKRVVALVASVILLISIWPS